MTDKFQLLQTMLQLNGLQNNAREDLFGGTYQGAMSSFQPSSWRIYGYPGNLEFNHFYTAYERIASARSVVRLPVNECWSDNPIVAADPKNEGDQMAAAVNALDGRIGLFRAMKGVDTRQRVGRYGALFMRVADGQTLDKPLKKGRLVSLTPLYESQLIPAKTDTAPASPTYGQPTMYQINEDATGDRNKDAAGLTGSIHPSRVIIWAEGSDETGSIKGESALMPVFNSIMTLDKIEGAGGTGFFRNARGAQKVTFDGADLSKLQQLLGAKSPGEITDKLNDMVDGLNAYNDAVVAMMSASMDTITIELPDPEQFARLCWDNISAATGYPNTIMRGSQTGERASNNDQAQADKETEGRRRSFLNYAIRHTIDRLIAIGELPNVSFDVYWPQSGSAEKLKLLTEATRGYGVSIEKLAEIAGFDPEQFGADELEDDDDGENESSERL